MERAAVLTKATTGALGGDAGEEVYGPFDWGALVRACVSGDVWEERVEAFEINGLLVGPGGEQFGEGGVDADTFSVFGDKETV